jgi:hypothetical protein
MYTHTLECAQNDNAGAGNQRPVNHVQNVLYTSD